MAGEALTFDNLQAALESYGNAVRELYVQNLISSDRVASHRLIDSVTAQVRGGDGGTYEVTLSLEDYWKYLEYGTKGTENGNATRKLPPVSKILEWITVKPVLPRPDDNGRIPKPQQLAWMIAKHIQKHGTEGTNDLERAIDDLFPVYYPKFIQALTDDLDGGLRRFLLQSFDDLRR